MKILVIEDDLLVADALKSTLGHNYAVEIAHDGQEGLEFIEAFNYDLLLLDVLLPKLDGISICQHLRSQGYMMPIVFLTSRDSNHDRAVGLDAGADDYVVKPFDPEELAARIRALLRRGNDHAQPILTWEHLTLDPCNCQVTYQHQLLALTRKEYALLELFLRHSRQLFSCGAILEHLWTYEDAPSEEAVRTHIKGLRHKLKAAGAPADLLETVYGIGYRMKPLTPIGSAPKPNPQQLLSEIWGRHRDTMIERVESIEGVIAALGDRILSTELRLEAWHCAHTLAGALGTFGLPRGSEVAKQIELLLEPNTDLIPAHIPQLQRGVDELRLEILTRGADPAPKHLPSVATVHPVAPGDAVRSNPPWLLIMTTEPGLARSLRAEAAGKFVITSATELAIAQLVQKPQLIILDLDCFPQTMDGLTALSDLVRGDPDLPILVLSPQLTTEIDPTSQKAERLRQRIEVARRGGRLFLSQPLPASEILLAADRLLQPAPTSQARVLIVDDDRSLLEGLTALLTTSGMTVTTLSEPSQFWETLEDCVPDLLILDLDMPTYDGIELCQAARTDPRWANLPIMFLTAHAAAVAIDRVFAAGADDFMTKTTPGSALVTRIVNRLERTLN
jgi:DNA-binding response OmpR family regulator/HPt (histidine-containing phosphotransfer) domain-containing protein